MIPDSTIYTDGHDVVVTNSMLKVKNTLYALAGITWHGLSTIKPARIPAIVMMGFGTVLALGSWLDMCPSSWIYTTEVMGNLLNTETILLWGGIFILALGLNINFMLRKKYAVRIATAMGEKDVVISSRKEYIIQILRALDEVLTPSRKLYW